MPARAQVEEGAHGATTISGGETDSALDRWWLGGYFHHAWIPGYMAEAFFAKAPSVSNNGFGVTAQYRSGGGLNVVMGIGYMPYDFSGPFLAKNNEVEDTELVRSDLKFWHITGSLLWDIEFHPAVALEIGFGLDVGLLFGDVIRNEAYRNPGSRRFLDCVAKHMPDLLGPDGTEWCDEPQKSTPQMPLETDDSDDEGEHYHVVEDDVPPAILFPMLPHLGLRLQPFKHVAIKGEFAFGVVQMWAGVSLHVSFGIFEKGPPEEVFVAPDTAVPEAPTRQGRVLGKVVDAASGAPIAGATVRVKGRALSPLSTEPDGRFVVDKIDPGLVHFEVEHPEYKPGRCEVEIGKGGGDVAVECSLAAQPQVGAISGQVQSEDGSPVATPNIELSGPRTEKLASDQRGLFAAVDVPPGSYRIRVDADGYLVQMVEIDVQPQATTMPQIILIKQPKRSVVELRKQEIVITEQIQFKVNSSEILPESEDVLRQVADVFLRHPQIEQVEVQGHTDSSGKRQRNMELSQARAESVRAWLIRAGVQPERLQPQGYGPDNPIRANDTPANRSKNRRVQFIIRKQVE